MLNQLYSGGTAGSLIVSAIARYGDQPALADGHVRWSYREFGDVVARFISLFRSLGLKKGDALSILSGNRAESWAAISAAAVMGLRYTPLHPMAAEDDHAFILEDAEISALIVEAGKFAARGLALRSRVPGLKHLLPSARSMARAICWPNCPMRRRRRWWTRAAPAISAGWLIPAAPRVVPRA
jgi:fatty-acyl-CoA synthase